MARRSQSSARPDVKPSHEADVQHEAKPEKVTLRLRENDFISGRFAKKGSTICVSRKEAEKRLSEEAKWEIVS
jgi:hypothetical protein